MGRVLKKNWEGRGKIIKNILNTTIFCYINNYLPLQNARRFDPYGPPDMNKPKGKAVKYLKLPFPGRVNSPTFSQWETRPSAYKDI